VEDGKWKAIIESLIFASETPLTLDRIKEATGENKKDLQRLISELMEDYERSPRGFLLAEVAGGYQFRTRPEYADWIKRLKKVKASGLSQPSLETLAIIAYRQPIVRTDMEKIRGVDSGGVLRTLLERKLIRILGKKDVPGKPLVYGTSPRFLEMFGLKDLSSLPTLKDLEALGPSPAELPIPILTDESAQPEGGEPQEPAQSAEESGAQEGLAPEEGPTSEEGPVAQAGLPPQDVPEAEDVSSPEQAEEKKERAGDDGIPSEAPKDPGAGGDLLPEKS
jgi:segregation and condensation protein B